MSANVLFVLCLGAILALLFIWSFRTLPNEGWQILAAVPAYKEDSGSWKGVNFTYYGLFNAGAYTAATALCLVLMGALSVPLPATLALAGTLLAACIPSSKAIARIVEKKRHTFTIGGASFVGFLTAPWAIFLINRASPGPEGLTIPLLPALAALSIAYIFGEGIGRLACISFGCCYGRALSDSHPILQRLFGRLSFIFRGDTKKIAYASAMDGKKVLPVQGITCVVYAAAGLLGLAFFLAARPAASFVLCVATAQGWRCLSECLRADFRGSGKITAYQWMAAMAVLYSGLVAIYFDTPSMPEPDITAGLATMWNPAVILALEGLWVFSFLYTGRSMVTGSLLHFYVRKDRI